MEMMPRVLWTQVICRQPGRYIGWPSVVRLRGGELLAVFSGDRDAHVCPWGKTQLIRSCDEGASWSEPVTINNTPLDDRDAGIIATRAGTLLVSWFTSLAFTEPRMVTWQHLPLATVAAWRRHAAKLGSDTRAQWLGNWVRRSADGGATWGEPVRTAVSAPHGPIELSDGRLLYVGTAQRGGGKVLGVEQSCDDGLTWDVVATVPLPAALDIAHCHEPHVVEAAGGGLVTLIRCQPPDRAQHVLWQSDSLDGGATWTVARPTPLWGYPPHLHRLRDGRLLVVYGRRRRPFGERACLSRDGGRHWDATLQLTLASAPNDDLGYPASAELADGSILTVYYQAEPGAGRRKHRETVLMATRWLPPD